jgi:hypothetical protein
MAKVALIQSLFRVLNYNSSDNLHGLEQQVWDAFYEALEEEYNHRLYTARTLEEYRSKEHPTPDVILCAPLPEEGNPAPGLAQLVDIQAAFPGVPVIVWSTRSEPSLRQACLEDYHCVAYYTGTLLDAPEELPGILAQALA